MSTNTEPSTMYFFTFHFYLLRVAHREMYFAQRIKILAGSNWQQVTMDRTKWQVLGELIKKKKKTCALNRTCKNETVILKL